MQGLHIKIIILALIYHRPSLNFMLLLITTSWIKVVIRSWLKKRNI